MGFMLRVSDCSLPELQNTVDFLVTDILVYRTRLLKKISHKKFRILSQTWIILWNRKTLRPFCPWHPFSTAFDFTFFFIFFVTFHVINNFCGRFPAYASNNYAYMMQIMCYHVPVHSNGQSSFLIQSLNFRLRPGLGRT